jgi:hypothetical protein
MDRKGILLVEETLKMIIAVIALGFLIYFLTSLYFTKIQGNELNQANADIESIRKAVLNPPKDPILLNNPIGWNLFSFIEGNKPNACVKETCLCICDDVWVVSWKVWEDEEERQFDECNEDGACLGISGLISFEPIEIKKLTKILINKSEGKVEVIKQ